MVTSKQEWPRLCCVRKASSREQEEAVSNAIEAVLRKVMDAIRELEVDGLSYSYSSTFVAESVLRVYTITNIRCELRHKKASRYYLSESIVHSISTSLLSKPELVNASQQVRSMLVYNIS